MSDIQEEVRKKPAQNLSLKMIKWHKVKGTTLIEVFGEQCSASEMVKRLWAYIKLHKMDK